MGVLILFALAFAPWAFGTVHQWAIWTMNFIGYGLGILTICHWSIRRFRHVSTSSHSLSHSYFPRSERFLLGLVVLTLAYIALHALNARATLDIRTLTFAYRESYLSWLPHSYNCPETWSAFWNFLAISMFFFSTLHWLRNDSAFSKAFNGTEGNHKPFQPHRTKLLLNVLAGNATAIAFVGILQRLDESPKLLWLLTPMINTRPEYNFGPFAYRGNAATYFNLVWPICLFLLLNLRESSLGASPGKRMGSSPHLLLTPCIGILCLAPAFTTSRAGLSILVLQLLLVGCWLFTTEARNKSRSLLKLGTFFLVLVVAYVSLSKSTGVQRLSETIREILSGEVKTYHTYQQESRSDIYQHLTKMFQEKHVWGYGPGTFSSVYIAHRLPVLVSSNNQKLVAWSAWAHSDPLETLITYGTVGSCLIGAILLIGILTPLQIARRSLFRSRLPILLLPLVGFLAHSIIDFPFQVYSLNHLFVIIVAIIWAQAEFLRLSMKADLQA